MEYQFFLILAPFSVGILLVTGTLIYQQYKGILAPILLHYYIFVTGYLISNILELLLISPRQTLEAAKIGHLFYSFLPVIWFRFALKYSGRLKSKRSWLFFLFTIVPVLTNIFIHIDSMSHLIWKEISYFSIHGYLTMKAVYGPWMWIAGVYNYGLYFVGIFLILLSTSGGKKVYRQQSFLITFGTLFPLLFNTLYAFHLIPFLRKDFTPISFTVTAICSFIVIKQFQLFRVIPVARTRIVQDLNIGILVLDNDRRIVDFNQTTAKIFSLNDSHLGNFSYRIESLNRLHINLDKVHLIEEKNHIYKIICKPFSAQMENFLGTLITIIDVTKETLLAREKTALALHLEETNRELQEAQTIIIQQEKLSTIGQMTAGIAHEMNNPLSFLKSNLHTLSHYGEQYFEICNRNLSAEEYLIIAELQQRKEQMHMIMNDAKEGADRVIAIVRDLLKFSKPGINQEEKLIDLNKLIETSLMIMGSRLKYTAPIEKQFGDIPMAECRENEISQVVVNILSNAIQALNSKEKIIEKDFSPLITIRTWSDEIYIY
nr:two-component sensor histidine kinase [Spirochaetaceae bacterium]